REAEGARGLAGRTAGTGEPGRTLLPPRRTPLVPRRGHRAAPPHDRVGHVERAAAERALSRRAAGRPQDARPAWFGAPGGGVVRGRAALGGDARVPGLALRLGPLARRHVRAAGGLRPGRLLGGVVANVRGFAAAGRREAPGERRRPPPPAARPATGRRRLHGRVREPRRGIPRAAQVRARRGGARAG